ncbi:cadherin-like domain-containing protein [Tenacibaculum pacificus]|uniref:cadherin-like domain-containing protein n=1 Tax=Tenacibaculum pacificus TaxID=3018314 RepID=UPI0022F3D16C|nr:cadherin-like domain-containing protein [Tenacibaculum pacificus]WBX74494.1 cadherin-like domain-containing protein [Tenacibaculum pacificus]
MLFSQFSRAQTQPNAVNDINTTYINSNISVNVPGLLSNDTDIDNDVLTITNFSINTINFSAGETANFSEGNITINSDGSYTFIPNTNYFGNVSTINYTISDGIFSDTASLQITVENETPPIAVNDVNTTYLNTTSIINAPGVLTNDTDIDNNILTVTSFNINSVDFTVGETANFNEGNIIISADGSYNFTPTTDYFGNLPIITYTISDGIFSTTANLQITVENETAPIAFNDFQIIDINTILNTNTPGLLDNDTDIDNDILTITDFSINTTSFTAGQTANFSEGSITINANGSYNFIPNTNYIGEVTPITYTISDGIFSTSATLQITVENENEPEAFDDYDTADINTTLSVNAPGVLINDIDIDNNVLTVTSFSINNINFTAGQTATFSQGNITINANGSYNFIPNTDYTGNVQLITYTIFDGTYSTTADLYLTVENTTDLIEIRNLESCNQGYTVDGEYKVIYSMTIANSSTARDYHASSLISNIDLTNDLQAIFGNGCVTEVSEMNVTTSTTIDYIDNPYPLEFTTDIVNPNFLDLTSSNIFNNTTVSNATLYPRQSINIRFCVTINPFCNGRPNPTPSGSGINFDTVFNVTSSTGNATENLEISDFHTTEAVVAAALFVPEENPLVNPDGTFDYNNRVIITNEGTTTATNVNYNMGLGSFLDNGIVFTTLTVSQISGSSVNINTNYDGDTNPFLLNPNNSLAPGETIILDIFYLIAPISFSNTNSFNQLELSQTQGALDGFDETTTENKKQYSFVTWSDGLGNHLDRYYNTASDTGTASSTSQCDCNSAGMGFSFNSSSSTEKVVLNTNQVPNGILEHQELTFQITITNTSEAVQIEQLQLQDDLNAICSGNIITVSTPVIQNSTATINPILNPLYNGVTDINFFDGNSGILEANESITIQFSVLFNEECIGDSTVDFLATDPLNNSANSTSTIPLNISTDTDNDTIINEIDIDDDNDTITDIDEYGGLNPLDDHDNDFVPNYKDTDFNVDANNDGVIDIFDFDNDGVPNHFDLDSDNDGIPDIIESGNGHLNNNSESKTDMDVGVNGLHNTVENNDTLTTGINYTILNSDTNGNPNFIDIDSDGDGIVDHIEAQTTEDYIPHNNTYFITGIDTAYPNGIIPIDTDGDLIPDYIDLNSDNDIRDDYIEGWDFNNDGTPETTALNIDTDNDGLDDAYDSNDNFVNPKNSQTPSDLPNIDNTDTPERDWREINAVVVLINNVSATEGDTFTFTVSLVTKNDNSIITQSASEITMNLSSIDGTDTASQYNIAVTPYDYNQINGATLSIPAFQETATFNAISLDDTIYELDEIFTINGTITSLNTVNTETSGIGNIIDNDLPPTITMNDSMEDEGIDLVHTVSISHPCSTPINIDIKTNDDVAISPDDYTSVSTNLSIDGTINPADANTEASFNISTKTDNLNEPDIENLIVSGVVTSNNVGIQDLNKTGSIVDIDPYPIIEIEDLTVTEGNPFMFEIKLLNASLEPMQNYAPIILNIITLDETTTQSLDYQTIPTINTIPAYTESITQIIPTIDDNLNEEAETMLLQITVVDENPLIRLLNTGTIKDNDVPNLFSPNGDGKSDTFKIAGIEDFPNFKLIIYDRWGSEIYNYSNNGRINPIWWDGNHNEKPAPTGVYYYTLDFNDGNQKAKTNFIQLVR